MKKMLLLALWTPIFSFGQIKTTIAAGDFYNPLTWDCVCLPANGDQLVINHAVTMNVDIYYTAGTITINSTGSLVEDAIDRSMWIDGGTLVNHGTFTSHHLWVANNGTINNTGYIQNVDSMFNQATVTNSGVLSVYDYAVDEMATFSNSSLVFVTNNMHNQGQITNNATIDITHDFSNCNTQTLHGKVTNNGVFCVGHDFLNCAGDTITGSGDYFVGNLASNLGVFSGTHTFHTPSGSMAIAGTIEPGVTITTGTCTAGTQELMDESLEVYPNPAKTSLFVNVEDGSYSVFSPSGRFIAVLEIAQGRTDISHLQRGMYFIQLLEGRSVRFVKE